MWSHKNVGMMSRALQIRKGSKTPDGRSERAMASIVEFNDANMLAQTQNFAWMRLD